MGDIINVQKLKALTGQYDVDLIYKVPLSGLGLTSIPASLSSCQNITALDVSFNSLRSVEALASLPFLKTLVIVNNKIESLDSFRKLLPLEQLYLQNNQVKHLVELNHLTSLPNLKVLSLQSLSGEGQNPICQMTPALYRDSVLSKLPQLQVLDEEPVSGSGAEFYGAVRDSFELEPILVSVENKPWSKDVPWNDIPIYVPVQLDTAAFKTCMSDCRELLAEADKEIQKFKDIIKGD